MRRVYGSSGLGLVLENGSWTQPTLTAYRFEVVGLQVRFACSVLCVCESVCICVHFQSLFPSHSHINSILLLCINGRFHPSRCPAWQQVKIGLLTRSFLLSLPCTNETESRISLSLSRSLDSLLLVGRTQCWMLWTKCNKASNNHFGQLQFNSAVLASINHTKKTFVSLSKERGSRLLQVQQNRTNGFRFRSVA